MCDKQKVANHGEDTHSFAHWLATETAQCGWSGGELGRRAGLPAATVEGLLAGTARPTWELCAQIGRAFRLPPTAIFRRAGLLPPLPESAGESLAADAAGCGPRSPFDAIPRAWPRKKCRARGPGKSNREASRLGDVGLVGNEPFFRALHPKPQKQMLQCSDAKEYTGLASRLPS